MDNIQESAQGCGPWISWAEMDHSVHEHFGDRLCLGLVCFMFSITEN